MRKRGERCCKLSCNRLSKGTWWIAVDTGDTVRRVFHFCTRKHREDIAIRMYSTAYIAEVKKRSE